MNRKRKSSAAAAKQETPAQSTWMIVPVLLSVALLAGLYLAVSALKEGSIAGCGPGSGCAEVLQSRWAFLGPVPVSLLSVPVYLALLLLSIAVRPKANPKTGNAAWPGVFGLGSIVLAAACWFIAIQWFVLKKFCPICMTAHACAAVAVILLFRRESQLRGGLPASERKKWIRPETRSQMIGLGAFCVMLLAAGQLLVAPPTVENKEIQNAEAAETVGGEAASNAAPLFFYNGRFRFDPQELPIIGSPEAPHKMISLFDYTCNHCRAMHGMLKSVQNTFQESLAILSLPMPIDAECNPLLQRLGNATPDDHIGACRYARLALAVWRADRDKFHVFDDWLFEGEKAPAVEEARAFAAGLLGKEALQTALLDPWIEQQIAVDAAFYETNAVSLRNTKMPQLIAGKNISFGQFTQVEEVYRILNEQFQLKRPSR